MKDFIRIKEAQIIFGLSKESNPVTSFRNQNNSTSLIVIQYALRNLLELGNAVNERFNTIDCDSLKSKYEHIRMLRY